MKKRSRNRRLRSRKNNRIAQSTVETLEPRLLLATTDGGAGGVVCVPVPLETDLHQCQCRIW